MLGFFLEHDDEAIVYGVIPSRHLRDIAHRPGCPRVWVASNNAVILKNDMSLLYDIFTVLHVATSTCCNHERIAAAKK